MKKLMNIFLAIVFFNLSVFTLYYLGVIKHYSLAILNTNFDIVLTNLIYVVILSIYILIYERFLINKFNYYKIMFIGLVLGIFISIIIPNLIFEECLFIILYTSFVLTFISYSIYFEKVKDKVFK